MSQHLRGKRVKWVPLAILLVMVVKLGGIGCGEDSGGGTPNVNVGTGTGDPLADTSKTLSDAMGQAFQGVSAGIANSSQTIQCSPEGQATVSGDASGGNPGTFDLTADFDNCAGLDGSLDMSGEYFSSQTDANYNFTVNGIVGGNGCALELDDFGADITQSGNTFTFLLTGVVSATCDATTVTCNFNGVNSQDPSALQAACSCSGSGC